MQAKKKWNASVCVANEQKKTNKKNDNLSIDVMNKTLLIQ